MEGGKADAVDVGIVTVDLAGPGTGDDRTGGDAVQGVSGAGGAQRDAVKSPRIIGSGDVAAWVSISGLAGSIVGGDEVEARTSDKGGRWSPEGNSLAEGTGAGFPTPNGLAPLEPYPLEPFPIWPGKIIGPKGPDGK